MTFFVGHIYKITGTCGRVYIGSTINFEKRINKHNCKNNDSSSRFLTKPLHYEIIDTREYKLMKTLRLVEQFYLDNNNTVNEFRAYSSSKIKKQKKAISYIKNKEKILKQNKVKIKCECGCILRKCAIARHKRSPKHINLLNQKSIK